MPLTNKHMSMVKSTFPQYNSDVASTTTVQEVLPTNFSALDEHLPMTELIGIILQVYQGPTKMKCYYLIGFTTTIQNSLLPIIEPVHMVVYYSCLDFSLILLTVIAYYFYLNDKGSICILWNYPKCSKM